MAIKPNTTFTFSAYEVEDSGIRLWFVATDPGPNLESNYSIQFTDAELSAITTQLQLRNAVTTKLQRSIRATGIASKLDQFIDQSVVI